MTARELPTSYYEHPLVQSAAGRPVMPVALYVDGVPTTKRDGVLGFWVYSLITLKRFLVAVLRKSELCKRGCRGWCSLWPIFDMVRWSFASFAAGIFPSQSPAGALWTSEARSTRAGNPMPCLGALCQIKGDWLELCVSFGFPTWSTTTAPCMFCLSPKSSLGEYRGLSPLSVPWPTASMESYTEACRACEQVRMLSKAQHARVLAALDYDKRRADARGRALLRDIPEVYLAKGDRLEPSRRLPDVGLFEQLSSFPAEVVFW